MLIKDPATGKFHAPAPGEVFKNPTLAATLRAVAEQGKKGFYEGRVGQAVVDRLSWLIAVQVESLISRAQ